MIPAGVELESPPRSSHAAWLTVALCAAVSLLDGMDTQSIGAAAPVLREELGFAATALGPIFSAGVLGAAFGAIALGTFGDRVGRKPALVISVLIFAVFTLATIWCTTFISLLTLRLLAGIGLGGATPNFIALTAEATPPQSRTAMTSAIFAAFPLGGMVNGLIAAWLIPAAGWRALFVLGATAPILLAVLLVWLLPNTAAPTHPATAKISPRGGSLGAVLGEGRVRATLALWAGFFLSFLVLHVTVLWTPALLTLAKETARHGPLIVAAHDLGAALGMLTVGAAMMRFGLRRTPLVMLLVGAAATLVMGLCAAAPWLMAGVAVIAGLAIGAGGAGLIVLAAKTYPSDIRATGIGFAMAANRLGQVTGPLVASVLVGFHASIAEVFALLGAAAALAALAIAALPRFDRGVASGATG